MDTTIESDPLTFLETVVTEAEAEARRELRFLGVILGLGGVLAAGGVGLANTYGYLAIAGACVVIAVTAFAVGAALGFIFGIPRVLTKDTPPKDIADGAQGESAARRKFLQSNTNLERISDWLTTMIVGVALIQLHKLTEAVEGFQAFLRGFSVNCAELTACDASMLVTLGPIVVVLGAVGGFLFMYLYTRLVLTGLFDDVEDGLERLSRAESDAVRRVTTGPSARAGLTSEGAPRAPLSVDDAVERMFAALYDVENSGYLRAIDLAEVLEGTAAAKQADYWYYRASAWGQKHAELMGRRDSGDPASDEDIDEARREAVEAAKRAVEIDPSYRRLLRLLASGGSDDNDLVTLATDPEFKRVLG